MNGVLGWSGPGLAVLAIAAAAHGAAGAGAQGADERATGRLVIVFGPDTTQAAERLAARGDAIYDGLTASMGRGLPGPMTVRLFATTEAFLSARPLAFEVDGLLVDGGRSTREVSIPVDHATSAGPEGLDDALRHGLGRAMAIHLSKGRAPPLWVEGFARVLEAPRRGRAAGVARLRRGLADGHLHSWSDLAAPGGYYLEPADTYPLASSVAHFLLLQGGLTGFATFFESMGGGLGWADALAVAFGDEADVLEAAWRGWLPSYLDGAWQSHLLYQTDTRVVEGMLARRDYAAARGMLRDARGFIGVDEPSLGAELAGLLDRAEGGLAGQDAVAAAAADLADGDYGGAVAHAEAARGDFVALGDDLGAAAAAEIARRGRLGVKARASLAAASTSRWLLPVARARADEAVRGFAALGDEADAAKARVLRDAYDRRLRPGGLALVAGGLAILVRNGVRRRRGRGALGTR
ncbi:MAG: hypothetical protein ACE5EL_06005 [Anaerolineae bacterium]